MKQFLLFLLLPFLSFSASNLTYTAAQVQQILDNSASTTFVSNYVSTNIYLASTNYIPATNEASYLTTNTQTVIFNTNTIVVPSNYTPHIVGLFQLGATNLYISNGTTATNWLKIK